MCLSQEGPGLVVPYLENPGEAHLLVVTGGAKVHGARHIRGATVKLPAAVQQQQGVLVHFLAAALLSSVVNDGPIASSPCTACKACIRQQI